MIKECPRCGCTEFEVYYRATGRCPMFFNTETRETDCSRMYDFLDYAPLKYAICTRCGKRVPVKQLNL